ncbi:MAG TPA: tetratricopeptide repeat protein [Blastocatellia bacterium]|nr:tetratricopeptide repeat protein [Blastocatellia bacterium]
MKIVSNALAVAALVAAVAAASLSQNQADRAQPFNARRTFALVVGVSKYPKLPGGQQLQFADRDATLFAEAVKKAGVKPENIRVLIGAEATVSAIKAALGNWLARSATENDQVLFFFSGHGFYENEYSESYLLGYDSDAKDPFSTALSASEINQAIGRRVRSRHVLILADAMRKDFFDPEEIGSAAGSFIRSFNQIATSRDGVSVIIANGPGEFSREGQRWAGHGVFAQHIAESLSASPDRNGDGAITADELFDVARARIAEDTSNKQHAWRSETALAQIMLSNAGQQAASNSIARVEPARAPIANESPAVKTVEPAIVTDKQSRQTAPRVQPSAPAEPKVERTGKASEPATKKPETPTTNAQPVARPVETRTKPPERSAPVPPRTQKVNSAQSAPDSSVIASTKTIDPAGPPAPPRPEVTPPSLNTVSAGPERNKPASVTAPVPVTKMEAAPTPLVLELEAAISAKRLLEPKNASAWDLYQRLTSEPSAAADLSRLKPALADALADSGRAIVNGNVYADNIADRVDDFRRAGQMLARARSLKPDGAEIAALEKLSAAQALIALQFYDEAERTLMPLQNTKLASVENALGLVYQGKLDTWRAERAFKRATELDVKWAAPHYNLALLYRSQQNDSALAELERAAALDSTNPSIFIAIGDEYFAKQQWQSAADALRKAIALKPADDALHTKMGHALYSQGLQEEANREYQKARELRGKQP